MNIPSDAQIVILWKKYSTPEQVILHSHAVEDAVLRMYSQLVRGELLSEICAEDDFFALHTDFKAARALLANLHSKPLSEISPSVLRASALLHDLVRTRRNHETEGGRILTEEGYPELGWIIARHSNFPECDWQAEYASEAALLYMADKQISGTEPVSIENRYLKSRDRLLQGSNADEALSFWQKKYLQAAGLAGYMQLHAMANRARMAEKYHTESGQQIQSAFTERTLPAQPAI